MRGRATYNNSFRDLPPRAPCLQDGHEGVARIAGGPTRLRKVIPTLNGDRCPAPIPSMDKLSDSPSCLGSSPRWSAILWENWARVVFRGFSCQPDIRRSTSSREYEGEGPKIPAVRSKFHRSEVTPNAGLRPYV
jgi:hypothetical protein